MRKSRFLKRGLVLTMAACMTLGTASTAMAEWENNGLYWRNEDGSRSVSTWQWIDDNNDGIAECYYFDDRGYCLAAAENYRIIDGYRIGLKGSWIDQDGRIYKKNLNDADSEPYIPAPDGEPHTWVQTETGWKYTNALGYYVMDDPYLIDTDGDGVWEIYYFDNEGNLCQNIEGKEAYKGERCDEQGRLQTLCYKGGNTQSSGPYEVIQRNGAWYCVNGTVPEKESGCTYITNDFVRDARHVWSWIDSSVIKSICSSGIEYR